MLTSVLIHLPSLISDETNVRSTSFRFLIIAFSAVFLMSLPVSAEVINGIVISKSRPDQRDEFASVQPYREYREYSSVTYFSDPSMKEVQILNHLIVRIIPLRDIWIGDVVTSTEKASVAYKRGELVDLIKRYPNAAPYLKPLVDNFDKWLEQIEAGKVRAGGAWITQEEYAAYEKREMERENERILKEAAEKKDAEERDENLRTIPVSVAGRYLLQSFDTFKKSVDNYYSGSDTIYSVASVTSSSSSFKKLPKYRGLEAAFYTENRKDAYAFIGIRDDRHWYSFRLAVVVRSDGEDILNTGDLKSMRTALRTLVPELAEWLPSAIVTAQTKLSFSKNRSKEPEDVTVMRSLAARTCLLILSPPEVHDDGTEVQLLSLSVY